MHYITVDERNPLQPHRPKGSDPNAAQSGGAYPGQSQGLRRRPVSQARNVTSLKGRVGLVRLRVGNWRVIMRDGTVLHILNTAGRGSVYRGETTEERLR